MVLGKFVRLLKHVSLTLFLASILAACGSGGGGSSSSASASLENEPLVADEEETASGSPEPAPETESPEAGPPENESPETDPPGAEPPETQGNVITRESVRQFTFNHSLWDHASSLHANTVTGYWVGEFASASGTTYGWNGQFGQLDYHGVPPRPVLGSANSADVFPPGTSDFATNEQLTEIFSTQVNIDNVLIMPPNFTQGEDNSVLTTLGHARRVIDWLVNQGQKSNIPIYVYEHWPEADSGNLSSSQWQAYHDETTGSYHQWFLDFQDSLISSYPDIDFRTIPVGPIIAEILQNSTLDASQLSFTELYEDGAPHGRPTIYFLAGLVTYQAMYGQRVSSDYRPPVDTFAGVSAAIANDFSALNEFVWSRLNHYNANGVRVWP